MGDPDSQESVILWVFDELQLLNDVKKTRVILRIITKMNIEYNSYGDRTASNRFGSRQLVET